MAGRAWTGLDVWHGVEGEETSSEQSITVGVSHINTSEPGSPTQMAHPCDICGPKTLKDILYLGEHQETRHGLKPYTCGACSRQFWFRANFHQHQSQYNVEKPLKDKGKTSFVKNLRVSEGPPLSENPFTCEEDQKDFQASLDRVYRLVSTGPQENRSGTTIPGEPIIALLDPTAASTLSCQLSPVNPLSSQKPERDLETKWIMPYTVTAITGDMMITGQQGVLSPFTLNPRAFTNSIAILACKGQFLDAGELLATGLGPHLNPAPLYKHSEVIPQRPRGGEDTFSGRFQLLAPSFEASATVDYISQKSMR
ncbi:hypothetical protein MC885_004282 [Smutsia gigantea]|nr:hypothetical protein MC885_004282 [Smutsia gigantea]